MRSETISENVSIDGLMKELDTWSQQIAKQASGGTVRACETAYSFNVWPGEF
jgi:hypothetical protein